MSKPESPVLTDEDAAEVRARYAAVLSGTRPLLAAN
jgi:xylulokinase